ncbi:hemagglutinin family protein, partial [Thermosynechococcus sp. NK55a]|uniref:two-partner secretion domain-containing protein n=1 Tax=Thermosynechococcus sp. NK55a TaxID=1394889 RepID=UPI0003D84B85
MKKLLSVFLKGFGLTLSSIFLGSLNSQVVKALPQSPSVMHGQVFFGQSTPHQLHILQGSDKAIINWESFSIGTSEGVFFVQPSATAAALNRVTGLTPSSIAGQLSANGRIFLINPNGIAFLPTAQVDVAGLVASTLNIQDSDFMRGILRFEQMPGKPPASVINQGLITAKEAGFAALVAPAVQNSGIISARLGKVVLASGTTVSLDFYGDGLLSVTVDPKMAGQITDIYGNKLSSLIDNQGNITAPGGIVTLSAQAAGQVVNTVINTGGIIEAKYAENRNGVIILSGGSKGTVAVSGTLDVSGERGGKVEITGENVGLFGTAKVDASGEKAGGLIFVGGDYLGGRADKQRVNPALNAQNTFVSSQSILSADAKISGDGGEVIVWADNFTRFDGTITATGDNGGFVETSGKNILEVGSTARVDTTGRTGKTGTWLLDPLDLTIVPPGTDNSVTSSSPFKPTGGGSTLTDATINSALLNNNVVVTTVGTSGSANGDIIFDNNAYVNWATDKTFTVQAAGRIVMQPGAKVTSTWSTTGFDAIVFEANTAGTTTGGIQINNATLQTNGGNIKLTGKGGNTGYGVDIRRNANIISISGSIEITGYGGAGGSNNYGVYLSEGGRIQNKTGNIIINGFAGGTGTNNDGVFITTTPRYTPASPLPSPSRQTQITNIDGDIKIVGTADGSGSTDDGIAHWNALVQTTGQGNITYIGFSGTGTGSGNKDGLELQRHLQLYGGTNYSAKISATGSGNITLTGVLRGGNASDNAIKFGEPPGSAPDAGFVVQTNTGNICLVGEHTGTATSSSSDWMSIRAAGLTRTIQSMGGGNIILVGDRIQLDPVTPTTTLNSSGILVVQPHTVNRNIDLLGTASDITHLAFNAAEFGLTTNFSHIIFGREDGTGTVTVNGPIPITRSQHLSLRGGSINLNQQINLSGKTLGLFSKGGVVNQTEPFSAANLLLSGSGTFILNHPANNVNTIATAGSTGAITYRDQSALTVGSVSIPFVSTYSSCCTSSSITLTANGITTNNADVILRTNDLLTLDKASNLGSGNLTLISQGGVTQSGTGSITAGGLGLQGTGTFDLNNASNDVNTFAANVSGGVTFKDSNALIVVGSITSTVGTDSATTSGGLSTGGNDAIVETGNTLTLNANSNLGSGGNLTLISQGGVTQSGTGSITAGGLGLQGTGTFDLNNA